MKNGESTVQQTLMFVDRQFHWKFVINSTKAHGIELNKRDLDHKNVNNKTESFTPRVSNEERVSNAP